MFNSLTGLNSGSQYLTEDNQVPIGYTQLLNTAVCGGSRHRLQSFPAQVAKHPISSESHLQAFGFAHLALRWTGQTGHSEL